MMCWMCMCSFLRLNTAVAQVTVMANHAFRYATVAQIQQHLAAGGPALETYADVGSNHRTVIHFAAFDNALEYLVIGGFDIEEAMMLLIPEAWEKNKHHSKQVNSYFEYFKLYKMLMRS